MFQVFIGFELETKFAKLKLVQNEEINNLVQNEKINNEELETADYNTPLIRDLAEISPEAEIITPNNPPWNGWIASGVWGLSVAAILIFPMFFLLGYVLIKIVIDRQMPTESSLDFNTAVFVNLIAIIPAHIFTLAVAWFVATKNRKFSLKDTLGLSSGGFRWWYYPLIIVVFFAVNALVGYFIPEGDNDLLRMMRSSRMAVYTIVILATFTAPLVEEVVYRGILYSAFQRSVGVKWAILIVTLMFAGVHVPQYWGSPGAIVLICLLSLVLTMIRVKTNNLLPCIIMHTIFNGIQSVLFLIEPYLLKIESNVQEQAALIFKLFT